MTVLLTVTKISLQIKQSRIRLKHIIFRNRLRILVSFRLYYWDQYTPITRKN